MISKLWSFLKSETGSYLFFGGMTTLINYIVFVAALEIGGGVIFSNTVAFIFAVAFAYFTNKIYVFKSKSWKASVLVKEILAFVAARIFSFLFETAGLWFTEDILESDDTGIMIAKVVLSIIVVLLNWVLSKFFVFKKAEK